MFNKYLLNELSLFINLVRATKDDFQVSDISEITNDITFHFISLLEDNDEHENEIWE